jgi:NMD protein affecting ribosome stability and mRNA decay
VKARLLRSLIAERVSSVAGPGDGWTVGRCRHCDTAVWLSHAWVELLAGDPQALASCFECACAEAAAPR